MIKLILIKNKKPRDKKKRGQVILEYVFCLMVLFLMLYSLVKVMEWAGRDLAARRIAHDETLTNKDGIVERYIDPINSALRQVHPFFYFPEDMNAIWPEPL